MKSRYFSKPVCVICGNDGFDKCVLFNLTKLYEKLGFSVIISKDPLDCHLLVIARGSDVKIPGNFSPKIPIHVYNYVGNSLSNILRKISDNPYYVISPSQDLLDYNSVEFSKGVVAFPPVYSDFWISHLTNQDINQMYEVAHIGNNKSDYGASQDKYSILLSNAVCQGHIDIWGKGWETEKLNSKYHGTVEVYNVKHIYAKTDIALGIMYPFQRELGTFSSRFWQAPLNGALLLSEPNRYVGIIPGILEGDPTDLDPHIRQKKSRQELIKESTVYWNNISVVAENHVKKILDLSPPFRHNLADYVPNKIMSTIFNVSFAYKSSTEYLMNLGFS